MFPSDIPQSKCLMISGRHGTETRSALRAYKCTNEQHSSGEKLEQFIPAGQDKLQTVSWFWPLGWPCQS